MRRPSGAAVRTVLGATILLGIGSAVLTRLPTPDDITGAPFVLHGRIGEPATLRTGVVTVTSVEASTQVVALTGTAVSREGVFLVARVTWTATPEPGPLTGATLLARDGRTYETTSPVNSTCIRAQTGIPIGCAIPFEVPKDALEGAELIVPADPVGAVAGDQELHIDLGIDAAIAAGLGAHTSPITLGEAVQGVGR